MDAIEIEISKELAELQASDIGISEKNVKQKFLVPLLEALGHQRRDLDFERSAHGKRYDVFIKGLKNDCKVIVDTKRYGEDLNQPLTQIGTYATMEGALITVITNGVEMRLYSPLRGIAFDRSLLRSIKREDLKCPSPEKMYQPPNELASASYSCATKRLCWRFTLPLIRRQLARGEQAICRRASDTCRGGSLLGCTLTKGAK